MRWVLRLAFLFMASGTWAKPFEIPNTDVLRLSSNATGADYEIRVAMPRGASPGSTAYPTVYLLDADYSFALVRNVIQHFVDRGNLPPLVLVAIAYPGAEADRDLYRSSRTRDYTPTHVPDGGYGPEFQKHSGGAPRFADFVEQELIPFIAARYPVDKADRTIIGHSYGGLFGAYAFVRRPSLFQRYILVSPSLWYDGGLLLRLAREKAKMRKRPAHLFLSVGALEQTEMSTDLTAFAAEIAKRKDPLLTIGTQIFPDETHNSVFPGAVTRGLLKVFEAFPARSPPPQTAPPAP